MGYQAYYDIIATPPSEYIKMSLSTGVSLADILIKEILHLTDYGFDELKSQPDTINLCACEGISWPNWDTDMISLSKKFPQFLFEVYMDAEESEDFRCMVAKNGRIDIGYGQISYWVTDNQKALKQAVIDAPTPPLSAKLFLVEQ